MSIRDDLAASDERLYPDRCRVISRAAEVLGSTTKALRWFQMPNRALGDHSPISMLDTEDGISEINAILGRIEHGVYS